MDAWRVSPCVVALILTVAACSGGTSIERQGGEANQPGEPTPQAEVPTEPPVRTVPAPSATAEPATDDALAEVSGLIATAGADGLRLLSPGGEVVAEYFVGDLVRQPTWSRDGSRLVALQFESDRGGWNVVIVDAASTDYSVMRVPARRPYFFFSWSADSTRIGSLGPGPLGTSLDVLDANGVVVSAEPFDSGSLYLAWEPDGDDMLLNANGELWAVEGADDAFSTRSLGAAGVSFQAPSWLGARSALRVSLDFGPDPVVAKFDVDTGELEDLGPATTGTYIVVSPDHRAALLAHPMQDSGVVAASFQATSEIVATVELLDLDTGARRRVADTPAFWAEWSPDGAALLVGTSTPTTFLWDVWTDGRLDRVAEYRPSLDFFREYIQFAPAFIESPRLWSPDGLALTYGAEIAGVDMAVAVRIGEGGVQVPLGPSAVAFWSPVAAG